MKRVLTGREKWSSWRLRRLTGRETETSLRRWQSQERQRARVHACLSRRACVRVCACVCTCGGEVPSRGATEGGWKCYWSSAPRPATWDGISAYGNQINTHTHRHTHTHTHALSQGGDAILGTWAECWGAPGGREGPSNVTLWSFFLCFCVFLWKGQPRWGKQPSAVDREIKLKVEKEEEQRAMGRREDEMIRNLIKWAGMKRKRQAKGTLNNMWNFTARQREAERKIKRDGCCQRITGEEARDETQRGRGEIVSIWRRII